MKRKQQRAMSDFRSWVVAGYLDCWLGCWLHGRRQGRAGGPSFAFRVPPFFSRLLRHIPSPCCGNHARVRACATATVLHAWARTHIGETAPVGEPLRAQATQQNVPSMLVNCTASVILRYVCVECPHVRNRYVCYGELAPNLSIEFDI